MSAGRICGEVRDRIACARSGCRIAMARVACHVTGDTAHFVARLYQLVVESLMVSLLMIMSKEISHSILQ